MARVPYIDETDDFEADELVEKIQSGRRGSLINVYKLLLHSPPLAESWFDHLNQVRWGTQLSGRLREIVIIRIGYLNKVDYVLNQHVPKLAEAEGLTVAECNALEDWKDDGTFSAEECTALVVADAMTRDVAVPDNVFDALRDHFDERSIVELTILIGTYNMQNRVLAALQIDLEPK